LISDELLQIVTGVCEGLRVDEGAMARNVSTYGPFAATERVLMALGKAGADRQEMHERLREHAMRAWDALQGGSPNPLIEQITSDAEFLRFLSADELRTLMDASDHVGDAPQRARALANQIRTVIPN
jgi:adenylosuccinate lyase